MTTNDYQCAGDHYRKQKNQTWDMYETAMNPDEFRGAMKNNIMKYIDRYLDKGKPVEDLKKAHHYLAHLIEFEEGMRSLVLRIDFSKDYSAGDLIEMVVLKMKELIEFESHYPNGVKAKFLGQADTQPEPPGSYIKAEEAPEADNRPAWECASGLMECSYFGEPGVNDCKRPDPVNCIHARMNIVEEPPVLIR
jgi:hypothetical protein